MKKIINLYQNQKGISLPISLFVLIGVLLSAAVLMKTGDVSVTVTGNINSKSQLAGSNDQAINSAFKWLKDNKDDLDNDQVASGYFSGMPSGYIEYTNQENWLNAKVLPKDEMGNIGYIKIIRMCSISNAARNESVGGVNNVCYTDTTTSAVTVSSSSAGYGSYNFTQQSGAVAIMYKIIVKTVGAKNSTAITESIVSI